MLRTLAMSFFLVISLTACGENFEVLNFEKTVGKKQVELTEIEVKTLQDLEVLEAEVAYLETIDFKEFNDPSASLSQLNALKKQLGSKLDGIVKNIETLRAKLADLRLQIQQYMAVLDPNDPQQAQLLQRLQELLTKIDQMEAVLEQVIDLLRNRLKIIDQIFDRLISQLNPSDLKDILIRLALEAIREMIKSKLGI